MADVIASHLVDKAQALRDHVLALSVVMDLYLSSSGKKIDDMIFIVDYLAVAIDAASDDLLSSIRRGEV